MENDVPQSRRRLSTAEVRREEVLRAAIPVFAERGYYGTPTSEVAKRAGISTSYVFRLFPTKEDLFVAVLDHGVEQILARFRRAVAETSGGVDELFQALGMAYADLMRDRDLLMVQLHGQSACDVPAVKEALQRGADREIEFVRSVTGGTPDQVQQFMAIGALSHQILALDAQLLDAAWAKTLVGSLFFYSPEE
ncbi:TetR/AcrR family transcriptional regulator [Catenulispora rubra]|uniref:TetR/AcrR family transcriptional regulator n=1 Tax=Catenulispora rubra TaxID=280293 RepID=UPI00189271F3|nr:TetR/AcrR family transcriptional regulator [Catenulispora rubra]